MAGIMLGHFTYHFRCIINSNPGEWPHIITTTAFHYIVMESKGKIHFMPAGTWSLLIGIESFPLAAGKKRMSFGAVFGFFHFIIFYPAKLNASFE
jgi:hypothetical protein